MKIPRNPYLNRSMIRTEGAFFGRRREVLRMAARISSSPPQSVAVVGDRRVGKSSLLYHISQPQLAREYLDDPCGTVFLFLDFQEEPRLSIESFIATVLMRLRTQLTDDVCGDARADYDGLQQVVERLDAGGRRLILLLDEFDRVTRNASFDTEFFAYLRSLASHYNVAYVTSTNRDLQELCHTEEISDSPFFNIFANLYLGPFTDSEALDLICRPSADTPYPLAEHSGFLLELGGYLPFFLQTACSAAFEILVEEGECDRDAVERRFLEEARPHFQFYWEQMGAVTRALCHDLATGAAVDPQRAEYQQLVRRGFVTEGRLFSRPFSAYAQRAYADEMGEEPVELLAARVRTMEEELEKARQMQMGLLPQGTPDMPGLDIAGRCQPASHVGGDFYTHLWLDQSRKRLGVIGVDVMGHGMEGAVTALRFSETLRYEARGRSDPVAILEGLNRSLHGTLPHGGFVGCGIVAIDLLERRADVAVSGYYPPLHYSARADAVSTPDLGGTPLGIRADTTYSGASLELGQGDYLLVFSDGIVEAAGDRDDPYGEERLHELLRAAAHDGLSAAELLERLFWDVGRHSASVGQADDITAIAVRLTEV